jgi:hypothetical protein
MDWDILLFVRSQTVDNKIFPSIEILENVLITKKFGYRKAAEIIDNNLTKNKNGQIATNNAKQMKTNDLKEFNQKFKDELLEVGYKHVAMDSAEGERIVSYNQPSQKITNKFIEIQKRLKVLPDGVYRIYCTYSYGSKAKPDMFLIKKGNASLQENSPADRTPARTPVSREEKSMEQVTSLKDALDRIEKLTRLEIENEVLKGKIKEQEEYISELEAEAEAAADKPLAEEKTGMDSIGGWLKEIAPALTPIAEEYFACRKKELELREKQLSQGANRPRKQVVVNSRRKQPQKPTLEQIIQNFNCSNEDHLSELFDELDEMNDTDFDKVVAIAEKLNPDLADKINAEFYSEEEEEEEEAA